MSEACIEVSQEGAVGIAELAMPDKFNAMSSQAFAEFAAAFDRFEAAGSGVRVVLLRAQGKQFCTGADLVEARSLRNQEGGIASFNRRAGALLDRLEASVLPVIAACQGLALAGGGELMMACDVVFASSDFRFGDQHAQYGLVPGWGGTQRLPRIVGLRRSLDLFFSARWIDAATALDWGLVNHVVARDALHAEALAYCTTLAARSRAGVAAMKMLARQGLDGPLRAGLDAEASLVPRIMAGPDVSEGLAAFAERRPPVFGQ